MILEVSDPPVDSDAAWARWQVMSSVRERDLLRLGVKSGHARKMMLNLPSLLRADPSAAAELRRRLRRRRRRWAGGGLRGPGRWVGGH